MSIAIMQLTMVFFSVIRIKITILASRIYLICLDDEIFVFAFDLPKNNVIRRAVVETRCIASLRGDEILLLN